MSRENKDEVTLVVKENERTTQTDSELTALLGNPQYNINKTLKEIMKGVALSATSLAAFFGNFYFGYLSLLAPFASFDGAQPSLEKTVIDVMNDIFEKMCADNSWSQNATALAPGEIRPHYDTAAYTSLNLVPPLVFMLLAVLLHLKCTGGGPRSNKMLTAARSLGIWLSSFITTIPTFLVSSITYGYVPSLDSSPDVQQLALNNTLEYHAQHPSSCSEAIPLSSADIINKPDEYIDNHGVSNLLGLLALLINGLIICPSFILGIYHAINAWANRPDDKDQPSQSCIPSHG